MHEFTIGESLVTAVLTELRRPEHVRLRLRRARVVIGAMHAIVPDSLCLAYEVLTRETPAAGSVLEIVSVPPAARCRRCAWEGPIELPLFLCGACGSGDVEVQRGTELYLDQLEGEDDEHGADQGIPGPDGREREVGGQDPRPAP